MPVDRMSEGCVVLHKRDASKKPGEIALLLKVGAVCGSPARTDLCGGHPVTGVPTATNILSFLDWRSAITPLRKKQI